MKNDLLWNLANFIESKLIPLYTTKDYEAAEAARIAYMRDMSQRFADCDASIVHLEASDFEGEAIDISHATTKEILMLTGEDVPTLSKIMIINGSTYIRASIETEFIDFADSYFTMTSYKRK